MRIFPNLILVDHYLYLCISFNFIFGQKPFLKPKIKCKKHQFFQFLHLLHEFLEVMAKNKSWKEKNV